jgi:hypothetical protein
VLRQAVIDAGRALDPAVDASVIEFRAASDLALRFTQIVDVLSPNEVPRPSWLLQARRNAAAREEFFEEFGALDSAEVADLVGSRAVNRRQAASRLQRSMAIFAVEHHGQTLFPAFQFDRVSGEPKPIVRDVLSRLPAPLRDGGWQLALWWATPAALLDGARPVDAMDGPAVHLLATADQEAHEWADAAAE